jgi:hypothetical protein
VLEIQFQDNLESEKPWLMLGLTEAKHPVQLPVHCPQLVLVAHLLAPFIKRIPIA